MSEYINIYGSNIKLPPHPKDEDALNYGLPRKQQKWVRQEIPSSFDNVEYDRSGKLILTAEQDAYAETELNRCKEGVWIWIGGKMRYITKRYYFYLQYYTLEDGNAPEFREADRLYFLFFEYWFLILWCLGIIRIKKRRQGASSQSCSNILYEAIFFKNSNCGLLSKTNQDSKDTFRDMITNAYQLLPPFFKQKLMGREESVTELVLAHEKGGLSKINYRAPVLNAYDRGRMSYVLIDEGGKYPKETPTSQLLSIISKTLIKGVKRVGWADLPSTVNEMTKGGGAEFKRVWDNANQFKRSPTLNRIVRFFQPAYEAYEGFIDEFGDSVVDTPTQEQYEYLVDKWVKKNEDGILISELSEEDIKLGAKHYITVKRREGLTGIDLEEEIRMNPCDEEEAFMYAGQGCEFNSTNLQTWIKELEETPPYIRQMRLVLEKKETKAIVPGAKDRVERKIKPMDDEKGGWFVLEYPTKPNSFRDRGGYLEPTNSELYTIGVDTTKDLPTVDGSKPRILVFKKSLIEDGEEKGMMPVAMWLADTRLDVHFDEEVRKAAMWYGCKVNFEIDARTDYYRYFNKEKSGAFLEWTPKVMQNPIKPNKQLEPGTRSGDPFQLSQQLQILKMYIDGTDNEVYNGHGHRIKYVSLLRQLLKYDHSDRTKFDEVISLAMALAPIFVENQKATHVSKPSKVLPTYKIKVA